MSACIPSSAVLPILSAVKHSINACAAQVEFECTPSSPTGESTCDGDGHCKSEGDTEELLAPEAVFLAADLMYVGLGWFSFSFPVFGCSHLGPSRDRWMHRDYALHRLNLPFTPVTLSAQAFFSASQ